VSTIQSRRAGRRHVFRSRRFRFFPRNPGLCSAGRTCAAPALLIEKAPSRIPPRARPPRSDDPPPREPRGARPFPRRVTGRARGNEGDRKTDERARPTLLRLIYRYDRAHWHSRHEPGGEGRQDAPERWAPHVTDHHPQEMPSGEPFSSPHLCPSTARVT
jgi:hypothetical protein